MGDIPDRKSGRVLCLKGGVDLLHRNNRTPTPRLPGELLGNSLAKEPSMEAGMLRVGACQERKKKV